MLGDRIGKVRTGYAEEHPNAADADIAATSGAGLDLSVSDVALVIKQCSRVGMREDRRPAERRVHDIKRGPLAAMAEIDDHAHLVEARNKLTAVCGQSAVARLMATIGRRWLRCRQG